MAQFGQLHQPGYAERPSLPSARLRRFDKRGMFENEDFRFRPQRTEGKILPVRSQVSDSGFSLGPLINATKKFRLLGVQFQILVPVVHRDQNAWRQLAADVRDLIRFENVEL